MYAVGDCAEQRNGHGVTVIKKSSRGNTAAREQPAVPGNSRPNHFQAATSEPKLRGEFYTPPELVDRVIAAVDPQPGDRVLDPACGDGEFLLGVIRHLAEQVPPARYPELAAALLPRLHGFDVHPEAVQAARRRVCRGFQEWLGTAVAPDQVAIHCRSALEAPGREELLGAASGEAERLLILGNPPYVEAKRLPEEVRAQLKQRFRSALSGAPDLYLYFLAVGLSWLRGEDRLALVVPNKVLVNAHARPVRETLLSTGQLTGIDFATRAGLFPGAAVYPVVLYARAPAGEPTEVLLSRLGRDHEQLISLDRTAVPAGIYRHTESRALFPVPSGGPLRSALIRLLEQLETGRLGDVLEIRWTVSFHRQGLREQYVGQQRPASPFAERFLGGGTFAGNGDVVRYRANWSGWWIDYNRERLAAERNTLPPRELFAGPKIAICQNGRTLRAAWDDQGFILKDTLLCGLPRRVAHPLTRSPRALVGLLSSRAIHFYYSHVFYGGHVNGGYLHFLRGFLVDLPLGRWTDELAQQLEAVVRLREGAADPAQAQEQEERIEALVCAVLGLSGEEVAAIRAWSDEDENWALRDRVRTRTSG